MQVDLYNGRFTVVGTRWGVILEFSAVSADNNLQFG